MVESNGTTAYRPLRSRKVSTTDFLDSPGKKYPRLCILCLAVALFCFISWLPYLTDKPRGPIAFVWPSNQSRNARQLVQPEKVTTIIKPYGICNSNSSTTEPYLLVIVCRLWRAVPSSAVSAWLKDRVRRVDNTVRSGMLSDSAMSGKSALRRSRS